MGKELVSEELWEAIEPLLPEELPKPNGGRPRIDDRVALTGILFIIRVEYPGRCYPSRWAAGRASGAAQLGLEAPPCYGRRGVSLAIALTAANVHAAMAFKDLVDAIELIERPAEAPGQPCKCPKKLLTDKSYDFPRCREALRRLGIKARIARRGVDFSGKPGRRL